MKKKITIRDVAEHAGVSRTTVSYVLNGVNKMSDETRERVLNAIKELDYQPDFTAISLSKRTSNMIGVVIPSYDDSLAPIFKGNHYYTEILGGMEYVLRKENYDLLISDVREPEDCKNWVLKRNLDGLIFLGLFPKNLYDEMKRLNIPIALIDHYEKHGKYFHNIRIDDELGGYLAAKHLIEIGHTRISFVGHDLTNISVDINRLRGFKKALQEADIPIDESLFFDGKGSFYEVGYQMGVNLLQLGNKPTAIFASSDILAVGIMKAFEDHGKEIPKDYSIIGFDDLAISRYLGPSLTTIKQDVFNKGIVSAQTIIDTIKQKTLNPVNITLPVELVVRESTKAL